jgi:hypothetical protein
MRKITVILVMLLLTSSSCVTQRKCNLKFPVQTDTLRIVTVRDSVVYKDATVFIHLPGEIRTDSIEIPCPPPPPSYIPRKVTAETSLAFAEAWWDYPSIKLVLVQKDTTIERRLEDALKEVYQWRNENTFLTKLIKEKYVPKIYKDALRICIFLFITFGIWVGFKIKKILSAR